MKKLLLVLLLASVVMGVTRKPYNSHILLTDTVLVDSTEVEYTQIFWQDNGAEKSLLIEAYDDSTVGIASDSASVKIEVYQAFNRGIKNQGEVVILPSHAHPDSTTYPFGSSFILYDSLEVKEMDSTAVWAKTSVPLLDVRGDTVGLDFQDGLDSLQTSGFGAFEYTTVGPPDFSPGLVLKITGLSSNLKRGSGSRWIFHWFQVKGTPTKGK